MNKLAIITTHPIQYNAPIFRLLTQRCNITIKVFYTWDKSQEKFFDPGFGKIIEWDIPLLEGYEFTFVKNKRVSEKKSFWAIQNPLLIREIDKWEPNAVLVYGWNYFSHFQVIKYFNGKIPVYFRGDSTLLDKKKNLKNYFKRKLLSNIYKHVNYAFYVGENNRQYFLGNGMRRKQLILAPHAIDNQRFAYEGQGMKYDERVREKKAELGIQENEIVFLFVGKFNHKKNPQLLVEGFNNLNRKDTHLIFVGNGILEPHLKKKSRNNTHIHFLDFQNQKEMPFVYRVADVYVLPSQGPEETWGLAVNEAMACSKAVLVSNKVGCATDLVQTNVNGAIFRHDSLKDLVLKMALFKDKQTCANMGKESKKMIEPYNFVKICEVIETEISTIGK